VGTRQLDLVVANSSIILAQLRRGGFRRLAPRTRIVRSAALTTEALSASIPDVVILEHDPRGVDAFDICQRIRTELDLAALPVIVVSRVSLPGDLLPRIASSGCNEVLTAPLARDQLHDVVCKLLGLPHRRQRRHAVRARVSARGEVSVVKGQICDLTMRGARIQFPEPLESAPGHTLRCHFDADSGLQFDAVVAWTRPRSGGTELAVELGALPRGVARHLANLMTWRLDEQGAWQEVVLQEQLTELSDFSELVPLLGSPVVFDLHQISYLNSIGVSRWVNLLRQIPAPVEYSFARCSVTFCVLAGYIDGVLGRGRVTSVFAPYECLACRRETEQEIALGSELAPGVVLPPLPRIRCPSCGEEMTFADLPEQYFKFLTAA
jgi:CheY-like chemotaxis protein